LAPKPYLQWHLLPVSLTNKSDILVTFLLRESSDLAFSTKSANNNWANVAFPGQEEEDRGYPQREQKTVGDDDDKLLVTLLDILNSKGKNGVRLGQD